MNNTQKIEILQDFVQFCKEVLQIQWAPQVEFTNDRSWVLERRSFGEYSPYYRSIKVYVANRNTADILRTLAHEMVHHKQNEMGKVGKDSGNTGSPIENEANSLAGIILREYGKKNSIIYESKERKIKILTEVIKKLL